MTDLNLPIEAVLCSDHLAQRAEGHAAPGGDVEVQQHAHTVGQCEGGNVGVEIWIAFREIVKGRKKLFIQHEAVAAGMRGNDRNPFVECRAQPVGVAHGLVSSDQGEFVADMAEKREFAIGQCMIEGLVVAIGRIEVLSVWEDFHQCGSGIGATMDFFDCVPSLRIDRDPSEEFIRVGPCGLEHIVVTDEKIRLGLIEAAILVVDPVHAEKYGFLNMAGGAQFGEEMVEVFPVGLARVSR